MGRQGSGDVKLKVSRETTTLFKTLVGFKKGKNDVESQTRNSRRHQTTKPEGRYLMKYGALVIHCELIR
jgi:hypothetical protein